MSLLLKHDWERVKKESSPQVSSQRLSLATICSFILILIANLWLQILDNTAIAMVSAILFIFFLMPVMFNLLLDFLFIKRNNPMLKRFGHYMLNKAYRFSPDEVKKSGELCVNKANSADAKSITAD